MFPKHQLPADQENPSPSGPQTLDLNKRTSLSSRPLPSPLAKNAKVRCLFPSSTLIFLPKRISRQCPESVS